MTIYFAGGEDSEFFGFAGATVQTGGLFRSAFARLALRVAANSTSTNTCFWQSQLAFSANNFWFGAQHRTSSTSLGTNRVLEFLSSDNVPRIYLVVVSTPSTFAWFKQNAAGTTTQLGSNFSWSPGTGTLDKMDVNLVYNASGTLNFYVNGALLFSFSGDTTTDSVTNLTTVRLRCMASSGGANIDDWSEIIISDTDTRSMSLQTLAPVANGNTHNFDTGTPAAANVNETTLNDTTLDGSTTAAQIDQYTIPALATGTFAIIAIGVSARMQKGSSGPSKMDLGVRVSGTDYWSSDQVLITSWADAQNWWLTDPNTAGLAWAALPTNIGLKSVT